ncbi:MAG: C40 family peptidase [Gammaproteobacteria bacterium]|nr:C40 family peptidase [Gammaproteobacteria bacterium]
MDASPPAGFRAAFDWNAWVGLPYATVGNCWEFLRPVLRAGLGAELPPFLDDVLGLRAEAEHLPGWQRIPVQEAQPFDVLVFTLSPNRPPHVGVVIRPGLFLHCLKDKPSSVDSYHRAFWRERVEEVYHYHP